MSLIHILNNDWLSLLKNWTRLNLGWTNLFKLEPYLTFINVVKMIIKIVVQVDLFFL